MVKKIKHNKEYPHVIPDIEQWPIYLLHQGRKQLVEDINDFTFDRLQTNFPNKLDDLLAKTLYKELIRIKEEPWKVDPPKEKQFWKRLQQRLASSFDKPKEEAEEIKQEILRTIVNRYSEEIVGTFKKGLASQTPSGSFPQRERVVCPHTRGCPERYYPAPSESPLRSILDPRAEWSKCHPNWLVLDWPMPPVVRLH